MREWLLRHYVGAVALLIAANATGWTWAIQGRLHAIESKERLDRLERIERLLDKILDEVQPIIEAKNSNVSIGGSIYKAETK